MKYTIIHIDDRAIQNIESNIKTLGGYEYIKDIEFFDGSSGNAWDVINHRGIRTDVWKPYDGRTFPPLPGEYGIWESTIRVLEYIVANDIDMLLVIEDDVLLYSNAEKKIDLVISETPKDFDFISLYSFIGQNQTSDSSLIGSNIIHRSINQPAGAQAMIYSKSGAEKLLKIIRRKGLEYTSDCFIFEQGRLGFLSGYSIIPGSLKILTHNYKTIKSSIDPDNIRLVDM